MASRALLRRWWLATSLLLAGCGADSPTEPSTLAISALPAAVSIAAGDTTVPPITLSVARSGPATDPVQFTVDGAPAGVTATFTPSTLAAGASTTQLVLASSRTSPLGTSTLTVRAVAGALSASTPVTLTITQAPSIAVSVDSARLTIPVGGSATTTLRLTRIGGYAQPVALQALGTPGVITSLSPDTLRGSVTNATVTVNVPPSTVPGTYSAGIAISGVGLLVSTATIQITVPPLAGAVQLRALRRNVVAQKGRSTSTTFVVSRVAPFAGPVTLAAAPAADLDFRFTPAVLAPGDSLVTMTVTPAATAASRTDVRTITAVGAGANSGSTSIGIVVVDAESGALPVFNNADPISLPAGTAITVPVEFQRPPVNGTGTITLSTVVNPADGIVIRFVPAAITGDTARAEISVPAGTTPGNYVVSFGLNLGGFVDQRPPVTITVLPRIGESATIRFCDPQNRPRFFAVQDDGGPWRPITRTGSDYVFNVTGDRIGIAFVRFAASNTANVLVRVRYVTRGELTDLANVECETLFTGSRAIAATMNGLAADERTIVSFTQGFSDARNAFIIGSGPPGPLTVRFARYGSVLNRRVLREVIVRRNLSESETNPIAPVLFGSTEGLTPVPFTASVTNLGADSVYWSNGLHAPGVTRFFPGSFAGFVYLGQGGDSTAVTHYGLPSTTLPGNELQDLTATAYRDPSTDVFRYASVVFRTPGDRTVTFADVPSPFTWSLVGTGDGVRPRVSGVLPGVGARAVGAALRQPLSTLTSIVYDVTATTGWLGGSAFTLEVPDFRGLPGWELPWTLRRGVAVSVFEDSYATSGGSIWQPLFDGMRQTRTTRARTFTLP